MAGPSKEDLRRLALSAADWGRDAVLIDQDNDSAGTAPLQAVVGGERCYAVRVRPDILAVDMDDPEAVDVLTVVVDRLRGAGIEPVVIESGRPGHRHLFAEVPGSLRAELIEYCRSNRLDVRAIIRPPLSPHRLGFPTVLIEPTSPNEALRALGWDRLRGLVEDVGSGKLSAEKAALLRDGDADGRYRSRSELQRALLCAMVVAGWSARAAWNALQDPGNAGGERLREQIGKRGASAAAASFAQEWARAQGFVECNPPIRDAQSAVFAICRISGIADTYPWPGQTGNRDRAVLAALVHVAIAARSVEVSSSVRQLAELTNQDKGTVAKSLAALQAQGWIKLVQRGVKDRASRWRLLVKEEFHTLENTPPILSAVTSIPISSPLCCPSHPVWHRAGLGLSCWRILSAVEYQPCEAEAITAGTGLTERTVRENLRRLQHVELAVHTDWGWASTGKDLDVVAHELGVSHFAKLKKLRHELQREGYRQYRIQRLPDGTALDVDTGELMSA